MDKRTGRSRATHAGDHLKSAVRAASFCGLFISLIGTFLIWAGVDEFKGPAIIWKASLGINLFVFALTWLVYIPFRNSDRLLGNGLLTILMLFGAFWLFGFSGFYFYFLFAPISSLSRGFALAIVTATLLHRAYLIARDIREAFANNNDLLDRVYSDEGTSFTFTREAVGLVQKSRRERNPFKSFHLYVAVFLAPSILILNRLLTPTLGSGHGIFLTLAFFSIPIVLWEVELVVQTIVTMVYYPVKLQHQTGKPVLLKDW